MNEREDNAPSTGEHAELSPQEIARDRMTHGLLSFLHAGSDEKESRIQRVLDQIDETETKQTMRRSSRLSRLTPFVSAAMLLLIAIAVFVVSPQPSAYAIVNDAIIATRSTEMLRYEISTFDARGQVTGRNIGTLDMRGELSLVQLSTPHGHQFVMGHDAEGDWSLRRDGSVERLSPRGAAPKWINLGESTIPINSVDQLLTQLQSEYQLETGKQDSGSDHIMQLVAVKSPDATTRGPSVIRVWIDTRDSLVDRLELEWYLNARRARERQDAGAPPPPQDRPPPPRPMHEDPIGDMIPPELISGAPSFEGRHHPPPPERVVFQRVEPILLAAEAFSPVEP